MNFDIYGGFQVPRDEGIVTLDPKWRSDFWGDVEEEHPGLSDACGCYILAINNKPWYVGLAEKQSFKAECFTSHKICHYNEALNQFARGIPYLYVIPKLTPTKKFAGPSTNGHIDVEALENILIGLALSRNPEVRNIKGTKMLREMNVPGILNKKKGQARKNAVQEIKALFGL